MSGCGVLWSKSELFKDAHTNSNTHFGARVKQIRFYISPSQEQHTHTHKFVWTKEWKCKKSNTSCCFRWLLGSRRRTTTTAGGMCFACGVVPFRVKQIFINLNTKLNFLTRSSVGLSFAGVFCSALCVHGTLLLTYVYFFTFLVTQQGSVMLLVPVFREGEYKFQETYLMIQRVNSERIFVCVSLYIKRSSFCKKRL